MQTGKFRVGSHLDNMYATYWCPGCEHAHTIQTKGPSAWRFNNDYVNATITPSILVTGKRKITDDECQRLMAGEKLEIPDEVCHSYITNGHIQFLNDCTHSLKGQTVLIPDLPDYLKD